MNVDNASECRYIKLYKRVYSSNRLVLSLSVASLTASLLVAGAYAAMIVVAFIKSYLLALRLVLISAVPFVLVSLFRLFLGAPRPYELFDLEGEGINVQKNGKGRSFPSRHVFSAMLIGSIMCFFFLPGGIAVLLVGVGLAVCRVLLGFHFIRDTVCGAALGGISGIIGIMLIGLI